MRRELLADLVRERPDKRPDRIFGILRLQRQEEANELLIVLHQLERLRPRANFLRYPIYLVVKDITKALGKNQRQDEFLVLRRILRPANRTRRVPDPRFQR